MVTGRNENIDVNDADIRNYTKFLLKEGSVEEKKRIVKLFEWRDFIKK